MAIHSRQIRIHRAVAAHGNDHSRDLGIAHLLRDHRRQFFRRHAGKIIVKQDPSLLHIAEKAINALQKVPALQGDVHIGTVLNAKQSGLSKYLATLCELDILEREVPVTEENPEKSKKGLYFIKDNFIRFWFRFVFPYRDLLEAGQEDFVLQKLEQSFIENHVSYVYENICREMIWDMNGKDILFNRVGRWWNKDIEIDIVAYDSNGDDILFGECKYSKNPKGIDVLADLKVKANEVEWNKAKRKEYYVIFSKSGFTKELLERAEKEKSIILVDKLDVMSK